LNVVPAKAKAGLDVRIGPGLPTAQFRKMLDAWCAEEGLHWEFAPDTTPLHEHRLTEIDRTKNPFFGAFEQACTGSGRELEKRIFPAALDSRFLRALGVPAVGFSPMAHTPVLLHAANEALSVSTFLHGIDTYKRIISAVADVPRD